MARLTDDELYAEIAAVRERRRGEAAPEPRATAVSYDAPSARVLVELDNGCVFGFPVWMIPGTSRATREELGYVEVEADGEAIAWPDLNADTDVNGLILEVLGVKSWAAKYLGSLTSPAKAEAARRNGRKGGRPRKQAPGG